MMALAWKRKFLSGFYPNCAEGQNPFAFRKNEYMVFENIGDIESFLNHVKACFSQKEYSARAKEALPRLGFVDIKKP